MKINHAERSCSRALGYAHAIAGEASLRPDQGDDLTESNCDLGPISRR
jgi:hypothetical protein